MAPQSFGPNAPNHSSMAQRPTHLLPLQTKCSLQQQQHMMLNPRFSPFHLGKDTGQTIWPFFCWHLDKWRLSFYLMLSAHYTSPCRLKCKFMQKHAKQIRKTLGYSHHLLICKPQGKANLNKYKPSARNQLPHVRSPSFSCIITFISMQPKQTCRRQFSMQRFTQGT